MKHKYTLAGGAFLAFLFVFSALILPNMGSGQDEVRSTTESVLVESPHNYYNNMDEVVSISKPGASWMKLYFATCYTERRYDYVYVYDAEGLLQASYSGNLKRFWSPQLDGDTAYIRLVSDDSVTKYGFRITAVEYEEGTAPPPPPPPPPEDTVAPEVSITAPTGGTTVSDVVTISVTATDDVTANPVTEIKIGDFNWQTISGSYNWDTTTSPEDANTVISARATDEAGNVGQATDVTVYVDNEAEPPPPPPGDDGDENYLGAVAGGEIDYYEIYAYVGLISVSVSWGTSADIDCYIMTTPNYASFLARGYTTTNPEVCSYSATAEGTYYIGVRMYTATAGSTDYDCHVTWQATEPEPPPPPPPPSGNQWALVSGVSDYKAISDLSYCDEDAADWYNYLIDIGYSSSNIRVLGDNHPSDYPAYYALATEYNQKSCLQWLADNTGSGDVVSFITSGHGSGDGNGMAFLCSWDCNSGENGEDGCFYDTELDDYIQAIAVDDAQVFVFIDHCYSGGMGPELMGIGASHNVYVAVTCTDDGYGYDDGAHNNGMWTYWFLEAGLIGQFGSSTTTTMEECFDWAAANYPKQPPSGDAPEEYDGNTGSSFIL